MLNTNGTRRARATASPARPSVSGGDIASTTSGPDACQQRLQPARPVKPPNARARAGMLRLSVGNGCTRVMRPHGGVLVADEAALPARLDRVVLVPRQRGDDVQPVPALDQPVDDRGHDLAGGRGVGREVRAEDQRCAPVVPSPRPGRSPQSAVQLLPLRRPTRAGCNA